MLPETLSLAQAQRIALAAQGFSASARLRQRRPFDPALERLHVLQIDSVNVFSRSHYLPVFSRHGSYDREALDTLLMKSGQFTEYPAHEASFIPVSDRPLFAWRMEEFRERHLQSGHVDRLASEITLIRSQLDDMGTVSARQLEPTVRGEKRGPWWDWSNIRRALEMLYLWGEVAMAPREGFQRRFGLAHHILPPEALETVPRGEAQRQLVERAARCLGVGTLADLADYHRLSLNAAGEAAQTLQDEGTLIPVTVKGWVDTSGNPLSTWLHRDTRIPNRLPANALLTPFDPVVWFRPRAERLFDFHYRIEIYTPKAKRKYGYYCLPLLVQGKMAGRIDLKADRRTGALLVQAAWQEDRAPASTAQVAADLLRQAAAWQGLSQILVAGVGNLDVATPGGFERQ